MPPDPSEPTTLTTAASEFQAATIARALEARGIPARVIGALTTGFRAEAPGVAKVMVLTRDLDRARAALGDIQNEGDDIDWSEAERHPSPDSTPPPAPLPFRNPPDSRALPQSERRWGWTLIFVVLLPAGGFLTVLGQRFTADVAVQAIGPIIICIAAVMALWLISTRPEDDAPDEDGRL